MGQGMKSSKSGMKSDENNDTGRLDRSSLAPRPLGLVGRRRGVVPAAATVGSPEIGDSDTGGVEIITPTQARRQQTQQQSLDQQEQFSSNIGDSFACCGPERQRPFSNYPLSDTPQPSSNTSLSVGTTSTTATDSHAMKGESSLSSSSSSHDQQATLLSELALVCEQVILPHDLVPDVPFNLC